MKTIALVMIVKNEERCLKRCLDSAQDLVDQIVIVDTGSQDNTIEIARKAGANVYTYAWKNDFAAARNYALSLSNADWNLVLDADEYISVGNKKEIAPFLKSNLCLGDICIRNSYLENGEISYFNLKLSRLLPKGIFYKGKIHEQIDSRLPSVSVPIFVEHDGYLQTGEKEKRNLPYLLRELQERPQDAYLLYKIAGSYQILGEEKKALDIFRKFYRTVSLKAPYRSKGVVGFLYSLMNCKNYAEVLKIIESEKKSLESYASFHFFCGVFYMQLILSNTAQYIGYLPKIEQEYLRCLEIGTNLQDEEDLGAGSYKAAYNLGTWYEVSGDLEKARKYYKKSSSQGYQKAYDRLKAIK